MYAFLASGVTFIAIYNKITRTTENICKIIKPPIIDLYEGFYVLIRFFEPPFCV